MFDLPEHLLHKIIEYLSPVDQVCFILSGKGLFCLYGSVLSREAFRFPRLLYIRNPTPCLNTLDVTRKQLLIRLENDRMAFCAGCLMLHPRKEFRTLRPAMTIPP